MSGGGQALTAQRLLRYIDDFLLVTTDLGRAKRFVKTMAAGFPEYGAHVSPAKSLLSFEMVQDGLSLPVAPTASDGHCCKWVFEEAQLRFPLLWFLDRHADTRL